jgi:hypothetical protein
MELAGEMVYMYADLKTSIFHPRLSLCQSSGLCKGKVVPLHAMEALWVRGGIAPTLS